MKTYILKPIMTLNTLSTNSVPGKPGYGPAKAVVPPRQPLPTPVIDPIKPILHLGLDVHLEFIMAVAQRAHTPHHAPRKFTPEQLVTHKCIVLQRSC